MTAAFTFFFDSIVAGFSWFSQVFAAAGLMDIFTGLIIITLVFYRLLAPMLRSAGSDRARRSSRKDNSNG